MSDESWKTKETYNSIIPWNRFYFSEKVSYHCNVVDCVSALEMAGTSCTWDKDVN